MFAATDLAALLPEAFMLGAICALLLIDLFIDQSRRGLTHFLAITSLVFAAILTLRTHGAAGGAVEPVRAFGGMFVRDGFGDLLKLAIHAVTIGVFVYAKPYLKSHSLFQGEFYVLALTGVLGMMVLFSAGNLVVVYLGLELLALSSYALVALDRDSRLAS